MASGTNWNILQEHVGYDSPHLRVVEETVCTPSRPGGRLWLTVRRKQAVVIAPFTPEGKLVLIRQERVPIRRIIWEFPAGQIDGDAGPTEIRDTALRELREEAGYTTQESELLSLGIYFSSAGFTDECMHLFAARNVTPCPHGPAHEQNEVILETRAFSPNEVWNMIDSGEIVDANTLSLCARLHARGIMAFSPAK